MFSIKKSSTSLFLNILILVGIFFTIPIEANANTYYVSTSGNDSNNGSQSTPWKTIQKAANSVNAGDIVTVAGGTYEERVNINRSGQSGQPIIFQANSGVVTRGFTLQESEKVPVNYITIKGFKVDSAIGVGIEVLCKHCIIENNYIYYASKGGILLASTDIDPAVTTDVIVRNNRLERNGLYGIDVRGRNHIIEGNEIWDTIQRHPNLVPLPSYADADGIHFHGSGHIFRNNYIHDIKYDDIYVTSAHIDCFQTFKVFPYQEAASNVTFENNRCVNPYYCHSSACLANPGQAVTKGFMLQFASNLTIKNNIIYTYNGIKSDRPATDPRFTILNNTFIGLTDPNELQCTVGSNCWPSGLVLDTAINSVIKNNIFIDQLYKVFDLRNATTGMDMDYNLAYRNNNSTPPGKPPSPFGQHDLWGVNPKFVNFSSGDYHLNSDSPACTGGENTTYIGAFSCNFSVSPTLTLVPPTLTSVPLILTSTPTLTPSPILGDITGPSGIPDNKVDTYDYNQLISYFGKTGSPGFIKADIILNGVIDIYDYNIVVKNYGKSQ